MPDWIYIVSRFNWLTTWYDSCELFLYYVCGYESICIRASFIGIKGAFRKKVSNAPFWQIIYRHIKVYLYVWLIIGKRAVHSIDKSFTDAMRVYDIYIIYILCVWLIIRMLSLGSIDDIYIQMLWKIVWNHILRTNRHGETIVVVSTKHFDYHKFIINDYLQGTYRNCCVKKCRQ